MRTALALAAVAAAVSAFGIALAASTGSGPTILTHPANPTNQLRASFTYTYAHTGAAYQCRIDAAAYAACPSGGIAYTSLGPGSHTFGVEALVSGKPSAASTFTWLIDTTPPTASLAFPLNGGAYSAAAWGAGCSGGGAVCGQAADQHGVASVSVSARRAGAGWWDGTGWNAPAETFRPATLQAPGANSTAWRLPLALPADGSYTIHVRAVDAAGNETPSGSQAAATFTVDTIAPPAPVLESSPEAESGSRTARFTFSDAEASATLLCSRDHARPAACTSPETYEGLALGSHTFSVQARDAAGNTSAAANFAWTIERPLTIAGNLVGALAPGYSRELALTIGNPNSSAIHLTRLTVTAVEQSTKPGCLAAPNLRIVQTNITEAHSLVLAAGGHATLPLPGFPSPQVAMLDLASNQDACKGATFTFDYSAGGHS